MKWINSHGFTLIELALIVALAFILSSFGVFTFKTLIPSLKLSGSAREISATLQVARVKAISNNRNYKVVFNASGTYQTYLENPADTWLADGSARSLAAGISFNRNGSDPITFASDQAIFTPTGGLSGISGGVYLKNSRGQIYAVTVVNTTGRVKVQKE